MAALADRGVQPGVVADQVGRLTFTGELVRAIRHLLDSNAAYGTYNVSNSGPPMSWAEIARTVFEARGKDPAAVTDLTTAEYREGKSLAPRPQHSVLSLDKIIDAGFRPAEASAQLAAYLAAPR